MKTAREYGYEYAAELGFDAPVDIDKMVTRSQSIPDGDYTAMVRDGVEPDARNYWRGFNSFFD
ncbi:MAG: hypothetical protein WC294_08205 [Methanoregula sp.]|jgi:hypothetical protein